MYIQSHINGYDLRTKVLTKREEIMRGMMGRTFSKNFSAVLFVMPVEESSFWMKNCIIPLDVVFIQDGKVTKMYHNCPPCLKSENKCKSYPGVGNLVLELEGGTCKQLKLKRGDKITFSKK